jgi:hypothetical protein
VGKGLQVTIPSAWYSEMSWDDMDVFLEEIDPDWKTRGYPDVEEAFYQSVQYMPPKEFLDIKKRLAIDWDVVW